MVNLRVISIAVAVVLGMLGAVQLAAPESLGISPMAARWLGIVATGLGILAGFLPRVTGPTTDPSELTDRVSSLPASDQREIVSGVVASASESQDMDAVPLLASAVGSLSVQDRDRLVRLLESRQGGPVSNPPAWLPPADFDPKEARP